MRASAVEFSHNPEDGTEEGTVLLSFDSGPIIVRQSAPDNVQFPAEFCSSHWLVARSSRRLPSTNKDLVVLSRQDRDGGRWQLGTRVIIGIIVCVCTLVSLTTGSMLLAMHLLACTHLLASMLILTAFSAFISTCVFLLEGKQCEYVGWPKALNNTSRVKLRFKLLFTI